MQNAAVYLKVLNKASTHQIQDWKQDDVKNAFKWTGYFQKVIAFRLVASLLANKFIFYQAMTMLPISDI